MGRNIWSSEVPSSQILWSHLQSDLEQPRHFGRSYIRRGTMILVGPGPNPGTSYEIPDNFLLCDFGAWRTESRPTLRNRQPGSWENSDCDYTGFVKRVHSIGLLLGKSPFRDRTSDAKNILCECWIWSRPEWPNCFYPVFPPATVHSAPHH
jgi:hypothetical protein